MNKNLKVTYDKSLKLMQVSPSAWQAIGPLQWFDDYRIISTFAPYFANDARVIDLAKFHRGTDNVPTKITSILASQTFQDAIAAMQLERHSLILGRPNSLPIRQRVLSNDSELASKFENKVWLREYFSEELNFPPFVILPFKSLLDRTLADDIKRQLKTDALIIQHPQLSGGRGTYSVADAAEYEACIRDLGADMKGKNEDLIVISKRLPHILERTLQACITDDAVYVGPAQAQLVGHSTLVSKQPGAIQFCGGKIGPELVTAEQYEEMTQAVQIIGKNLREQGYRGIFGMDFIISDGQVYPIEVNPRLTGLSLLLAFLQEEVPFLLLHILELARSTYKIAVDPSMADRSIQGSFIQVYAQAEGVCTLRSGLYDSHGNWLTNEIDGGGIIPKNEEHYFVAMRVAPGQRVSEGKSLAFIYSKHSLFDSQNELDPVALELVRKVRK